MDNNKINYEYRQVVLDDGTQAYAVSPIDTCTHYTMEQIKSLYTNKIEYFVISVQVLKGQDLKYFIKKCQQCKNEQENWLCLTCLEAQCSRYVNNHMSQHYETTKHCVALSCQDFSFWCYICDSYITSKGLTDLQKVLSSVRFGVNQTSPIEQLCKYYIMKLLFFKEIQEILSKMSNLVLKDNQALTKNQLIDGILQQKFKKIVLLTGAGISVAAGIPDFRSPKIGIYDQLAAYDLPYPEALFELKYFRQKVYINKTISNYFQPQAFYKIALSFFGETQKAKPVLAHKFIKALEVNGQLLLNFTQNIDGLELIAGVSQDKLVQAHGHMRSAHCIDCKKEHDIKKMMEAFLSQQIYKCDECNGLIKPDIIFFGEQLPNQFEQNWQFLFFFQKFHLNRTKIHEADLIIVMGTSLKVAPFNMLPYLANDVIKIQSILIKIPIVVINRENVVGQTVKSLFLQGDIEDVIGSLAKDLGWNI